MTEAKLVVTEGIAGTHRYHLSEAATPTVALCGARTMATDATLASWGTAGHLMERYCSRCEVAQVKRQAKPDPRVLTYPSPCCGQESVLTGTGRTARCSQCGQGWQP